ncbi:MAG: hypothetical protein KTR21_06300 [Rhodobacteraceae bacterium]|nr:hypothetical protein [Paracoccaceae bacterium]
MNTLTQAPVAPESAYSLDFTGPTAQEQFAIELVNRARANPLDELGRQDDGFASGVSTNPSQPLAVVGELQIAAVAHSLDMNQRGFFSHDNPDGQSPFDRMDAVGYRYRAAGENIAWAAGYRDTNSPAQIQRHHDGLWESDGHQRNFMNSGFSEIGMGVVTGPMTLDGRSYNTSSTMTQKFGDRGKVYLTGVVIDDLDGDAFYDVGEGQGDVRITAWNEDGVYGAITWEAGGYSLELTPGTYTVQFEGGDLDGVATRTVTVGQDNVKLDVFEDAGVEPIIPEPEPVDPLPTPPEPAPMPLVPEPSPLPAGAGADEIAGSEAAEAIYGRAGDDLITALGGDDQVYGGADSDEIHGGEGGDTLFGNSGDDMLMGDDGADELYGGSGDDELFGGIGDDFLVGQGGDDALVGGAGNDKLAGRSGSDILFGGEGDDLLIGGGGVDELLGEAGDDVLRGGADNDIVHGGFGDDIVTGDFGDDQVIGGFGDDVLAGGVGADMFMFGAEGGSDVVRDFEQGLDRLDLSQRGAAFSDLIITDAQNGARVTHDDLSILIKAHAAANISADDFIF